MLGDIDANTVVDNVAALPCRYVMCELSKCGVASGYVQDQPFQKQTNIGDIGEASAPHSQF